MSASEVFSGDKFTVTEDLCKVGIVCSWLKGRATERERRQLRTAAHLQLLKLKMAEAL